jgi:hypothetical protein
VFSCFLDFSFLRFSDELVDDCLAIPLVVVVFEVAEVGGLGEFRWKSKSLA